MKNLFNLLSLAVLILTCSAMAESTVVQDNACFIVSGTKHDHNGALKALKKAEQEGRPYQMAGYQCKIFNSYKEIGTHLQKIKLPKDSAIFIVQIAHGGGTGSALLNSGNVTSEQILKNIRELSQDYQVAFVNQSCYGGNALMNKIVWDKQNPDSESIDRSCIWTGSSPGRVALGLDTIPQSKKPYTLEEAYSKKPDGIMSSAAWDQVNITDYYESIAIHPGYTLNDVAVNEKLFPHTSFMNEMQRLIADSLLDLPSESKVIIESALYVLDPDTTDEMVKKKLAIKINPLQRLEEIRQAIFFAPATTNVCSQVIRKFIVSEWYTVFSHANENGWPLFNDHLKTELKKYPGSEACSNLGEMNQSPLEWSRWLAKHSPLGDVMNKFYFIQKVEAVQNDLTFDQAFNKKSIMQNIIGKKVSREESHIPTPSEGVLPYPFVGVNGATGNVLPAFNLASFKTPNMSHPLDERRRNACRSIKLKAW